MLGLVADVMMPAVVVMVVWVLARPMVVLLPVAAGMLLAVNAMAIAWPRALALLAGWGIAMRAVLVVLVLMVGGTSLAVGMTIQAR